MQTAKLFTNGQSQAVRLPKEFRFDGNSVGIKRLGQLVVLFPQDQAWDNFIAAPKMSDDFFEIMEHRHDNETQTEREAL